MKFKLKNGICALSIALVLGIGVSTSPKMVTIPETKQNDLLVLPNYAKGDNEKDPYSVDELLTATQNLGKNKYLNKQVYVTGIVSDTPKVDNGALTFHIKDEGGTKQLLIYKIRDKNNKANLTADSVKKGDLVVATGNVENFKGTIELCYNFDYSDVKCKLLSVVDASALKNDVALTPNKIDFYVDSNPLEITAKPGTNFGKTPTVTWSVTPDDNSIISLEKETGLTNKVTPVAVGNATITVKVDSSSEVTALSKTKTVDVKVNKSVAAEAISVKEAIALGENKAAIVKGIISADQGSEGIYIADKTGEGMLCYKLEKPAQFEIGDEVIIKGTTSFYNAMQLKDASFVSSSAISKNNEVKVFDVANVADVKKHLSSLIRIKGAMLKTNGFTSNISGEATSTFTFNNEELDMFTKKATVSKAKELGTTLKDNDKNMTKYDIVAIASAHNNSPQLIVTKNTTIEVNAYESLIQTLMGADTANQCKTKFDIAKKYFFMCDEETQKAFKEGTLNEAAKTRYEAWAVALDKQPYTQDAGAQTSGLSMNNEMITISIVSIAIIAISAIAIFAMVKGKRKQTN